MAVNYEDNNKFKALVGIIEDYTEWFARISLLVAYSGEEALPDDISAPNSFTQWLEEEKVSEDSSITRPLLDVDASLKRAGDEIFDALRFGKKPSHALFVEFKNLYSSFLSSVRRLEKDSALQVDGMDELTGMRPAHAVKRDVSKEMGRLERNGNPFTLAVLRIDGFESYSDTNAILSIATNNIKPCLRPFDDAYYLGDGLFLLSLKHADMVGGESAVTRIQNAFDVDKNNINRVTVSGALSEPVAGDEIFKILEEMKRDLNEHLEVKGTILKFLDISPLEKFVASKG